MDREAIAALAQFEPSPGFNLVRYDPISESFSPFTQEREDHIRGTLTAFVQTYLRQATWYGKPTNLDRFLEKCLFAIADYESQRQKRNNFDRVAAKTHLDEVSVVLGAAIQKLEQISGWRELDQYLENVFGELHPDVLNDAPKPKRKSSRKACLRKAFAAANAAANRYRSHSPFHVAMNLRTLKNVVTIAADKVSLGFGDARRDAIAQRFAKELAFAWGSGTGEVPTYSRPNRASVKPSPFASLLHLINAEILMPEYRSHNDFREYWVKAVKGVKQLVDRRTGS